MSYFTLKQDFNARLQTLKQVHNRNPGTVLTIIGPLRIVIYAKQEINEQIVVTETHAAVDYSRDGYFLCMKFNMKLN